MTAFSKILIASACLSMAMPARAVESVPMPKIVKPMDPPPENARAPAAFAGIAPYRYDDVLWENDRTAHRLYGHALEAYEPPSGSGLDAWGKNVCWPFMERQLHTGQQHDYHGEGLDFYDVGGTRGMGGLGIWYDNKLWTSRNYIKARILNPGPKEASFEVDYAPWPVDVGRKVWETRRFTLPVGTNFTRMVSTISSDSAAPLIVGIGIEKKPTGQQKGTFTADRAAGRFVWWGPTDPEKGTMGTAVMVDPAMIADVKEDADNYLVLITVTPGKPFVYYAGAAWDKGLDFRTQADWQAYVRAQTPDFKP